MQAQAAITPDTILQLGLGFWGSKTLLSAVELGLFATLASGPQSAAEIGANLRLHPRGTRDFLDALVSLGMLERRGNLYANTPETAQFLDPGKPAYVGGLLEMANSRLYGFWGNLTDALRTGKPQNEARHGGDLFDSLYAEPARLRQFLSAMTGISLATAQAMANKFPWREYGSVMDVGCAQGAVPVQLALAHPHLDAIGFDLPEVRPIFEEYVQDFELTGRVRFLAGNFFEDALPSTDVIVMGHILHDWDLDTKLMLLAKAYDALPQGGSLIVYEALIDDERRNNALGLLMSLNMLIETAGGFDYTGQDCREWMHHTGFRHTRVEHLLGPDSMVIGIK